MVRFSTFLGMISLTMLQAQQNDTHFFKKIYNTYTQNPIYLENSGLKSFTASSLYVNNEQGNLHLGQQPMHSIDFGLKTYGLYEIKKLYFFGDIDINRNYQQDKKWNLSYTDVSPHGIMPEPHYYAVSKFSDWNNQKYEIKGGFVLPILGKWNLAFWTNYDLSEKYRTEYDPRPKIVSNLLNFSIQNGIQIIDKHKIGIGLSFSRQNIDNKISFSDNDSQTPFYHEKYLRWMFGYGTMFYSTSSSTKRNLETKKFDLNHHYKSDKVKWLNSFTYQSSKTDTYRNANDENTDQDIIANLYSENKSLTSSYIRTLSVNTELMFAFFISEENNNNYLRLQNGKSYSSYFKEMKFQTHLLQNKNNNPLEIALQVDYQNSFQKDALAKTNTDITSIETSFLISKTYKLSEIIFVPFVKLSYISSKHSLFNDNEISHKIINENDFASKTLQLFYNEVVYPDHNLLNKTKYGFDFGFDFKKSISTEIKIIWNISSKYLSTFKKNNRYFWGTSLTLYY